MILTGREILLRFQRRHASARKPISAWVVEVEQAVWRSSHDVQGRFPSADAIGANRLVFNLKGNAYRLVVVAQYAAGVISVRFIGTHADYDRIDATRI